MSGWAIVGLVALASVGVAMPGGSQPWGVPAAPALEEVVLTYAGGGERYLVTIDGDGELHLEANPLDGRRGCFDGKAEPALLSRLAEMLHHSEFFDLPTDLSGGRPPVGPWYLYDPSRVWTCVVGPVVHRGELPWAFADLSMSTRLGAHQVRGHPGRSLVLGAFVDELRAILETVTLAPAPCVEWELLPRIEVSSPRARTPDVCEARVVNHTDHAITVPMCGAVPLHAVEASRFGSWRGIGRPAGATTGTYVMMPGDTLRFETTLDVHRDDTTIRIVMTAAIAEVDRSVRRTDVVLVSDPLPVGLWRGAVVGGLDP